MVESANGFSINLMLKRWNLFRKFKLGLIASGLSISNLSLRKKLAQQLIEMRGIPAKFVQIKSLTASEDAELWKLAVEEIKPFGYKQIEKWLLATNPKIAGQFNIDRNTKASPASIGQVQKVTLKDGKLAALKIRYPDIEDQLLDDLNSLGLAGRLFSKFKDGFSIPDYHSTIKSQLKNEMNYLLEAENQSAFRNFFLYQKKIIIPNIFSNFCSPNLICQEWVDSIPAETFLKSCNNQDKLEFSHLISEFYFMSIFHFGRIHTDPNPGNFGIKKTNDQLSLVIYDFGSVLKLSDEEKLSVWGLIENQRFHRWEDIYFLEKLSFQINLLKDIEKKIHAYFSVLLEPFLSNTRYDFSKWNRKERCDDILGPEKFQFMIAAPSRLFLVLRSFQGLFYWCGISSGDLWLGDMILETSKKLKSDFDNFTSNYQTTTVFMSTSLKMEVWKGKEQIVSLTLPRESIDHLADIIDDDLMEKIQKSGINIRNVQKEARKNAYLPMHLLEWNDGEKKVKIYLT